MKSFSERIRPGSHLFFIAISLFTLTLFGCKKEVVLPAGVIYLQIEADANFTSYSDNNDGIPTTFNLGTFYECEPGTYNYSAKIGNFTWTNKSYTLNTPADGKRRNYTLSFHSTSSGMSSTLDYDDEDQ